MVKISGKASSPAWQRAIIKATQQYQAGVRARHLGERRYEVPSATSSAVYTVEVVSPTLLRATCSCPHGAHADGTHCWHAALAICAEVERVSRKPRPARQSASPSATEASTAVDAGRDRWERTLAEHAPSAHEVEAYMRRLFVVAAA